MEKAIEINVTDEINSLFKKEFSDYFEPAVYAEKQMEALLDGYRVDLLSLRDSKRYKDDKYMTYKVLGTCAGKLFDSLDAKDKMICSLECAIDYKKALKETGMGIHEFDSELRSREDSSADVYTSLVYYSLTSIEDESIDSLRYELLKLKNNIDDTKKLSLNTPEARALSENERAIVTARIEMIKKYINAIKNGEIDEYLKLVPDAKADCRSRFYGYISEIHEIYGESRFR